MSNWNVNDKAVCIIDLHPDSAHRYLDPIPIKNNIYVVREVYEGFDDLGKVSIGLRFIGIRGLLNPIGTEYGFASRCFRKIVPRSEQEEIRAVQSRRVIIGGTSCD